MVKIAVVWVFPSRKAWICQMPDTNLAICSIFSSSDSRLPIGSGFLLCRFSLTEILVEGREVLLMMIHRCNALIGESFSLAICTPLQVVVPASAWIELSPPPAKADALANKPCSFAFGHWPSCGIRSVVSPFIINIIWFDITFAKLRLFWDNTKSRP